MIFDFKVDGFFRILNFSHCAVMFFGLFSLQTGEASPVSLGESFFSLFVRALCALIRYRERSLSLIGSLPFSKITISISDLLLPLRVQHCFDLFRLLQDRFCLLLLLRHQLLRPLDLMNLEVIHTNL